VLSISFEIQLTNKSIRGVQGQFGETTQPLRKLSLQTLGKLQMEDEDTAGYSETVGI
jgi:hypothetical protein